METEPAVQNDFFSRPQISSVLHKRLAAFRSDYRQNVGLLGQKMFGKTSILKNFLLTIDLEGLVPVYLEISSDSFESFVYRWMGSILHGVMRTRREDAPLEHNQLIRKARAICPRTVAHMRTIRHLLRRRNWDAVMRETAVLTRVVSEELDRKVIFVLDEFHKLAQFEVKDVFRIFGSEIMTQKDTMFIVSSSSPESARHIFKEELALLFGNFEIIEMAPLDFSEAQSFIRFKLGRTDLRLPLARFLLRITDGNPYYMDVLLERMKKIGKDRWLWRMNENVVAEAVTEELFFRSGLLHLGFTSTIEGMERIRSSPVLIQILVSLSSGQHAIRQMVRRTFRSRSEITKALSRLAEEGIVNQQRGLYTIEDTLFCFWLREVYHRRQEYLGLDHAHMADLFRSRVHELIREDETADMREVSAHVVELFRRFQNETVMLADKKMLCPKFQVVNGRPSNGRVFPVYAEGKKTKWMTQVVPEKLMEEDVRRFIADEDCLPKRAQKRIMITLKGAELNAKVMAKEHGLTLWNLRQLNQLFKLYDQPKVIF